MQPFATLSYQGQLRRLRRLAETAASRYGLRDARLRLLQYEDNAVYLVTTAPGQRYVLRVTSTDHYGRAALRSELAWLAALRCDTDVLAPEPVPTPAGAWLTTVEAPGIPEPRHCVLVRWVPGRPLDTALRPAALAQAGALTAHLHRQAETWAPPDGFVRPAWDWARLFGPTSAVGSAPGVDRLAEPERAIVAAVGARLHDALTALGTGRHVYGLIHADLHRGNYLVHDGGIGVIDFDDCGWGYFLFDIATTLRSVQRVVPERATFARLREAYLTGYARVRPLPAHLPEQLATFTAMWEMVVLNFILGSDNERVWQWGRARIAESVGHLTAYLDE